MSEIRSGEQVHLGIKQIDADGKMMMDLEVRWHGFENKWANIVVNDLIDAVQIKSREWSEDKNK